jgi:central glycolytic genes regulator
MHSILDWQSRLVPELMDAMRRRHRILRSIADAQLIGRRALAASLGMTERVLRSETDALKENGLLTVDTAGMRLTEEGERLLEQMAPHLSELYGLSGLADELRSRFRLREAVVVPGNADEDPAVKRDMGRAFAVLLAREAREGDVIAVAGGSTMAEAAKVLKPSPAFGRVLFVPTRGGLDDNLDLQANMVAADMARHTGGQYRLLHVPVILSEEARVSLLRDPGVAELVEAIRGARIVVHGIGDAIVMAERRKSGQDIMELLRARQACGEAFGYYFNGQGEVVHRMFTVGLQLEDITGKDKLVIGLAGGRSKGRAIAAFLSYGYEHVLITDEAAASAALEAAG